MPEGKFQDFIDNPNQALSSDNKEIIKEIEAESDKEYYQKLKKKHKGFLIEGLSMLEKERIAQYIIERFDDAKRVQDDLNDKIDKWDYVFMMRRKNLPGDSGDMPNYRSPISTVTLEVVHSTIMNVFFTPNEIGRVLPTEEGDIPKIQKLSVFMNWSLKNEMMIFEAVDRLFHNSGKIGETPYIVHWVKEYGTEIKREVIRNPANPQEPLLDPDTQEPLYQEKEEQKLLYNGPKLEVFSRKDYFPAPGSVMDKKTPYDCRRIRINRDDYLREEMIGKMYDGTIDEILSWGEQNTDSNKEDKDGNEIKMAKWEQEFVEYHGPLRINIIKQGKSNEEETEELEDEFLTLIHKPTSTLCQLRKNKLTLKMRPIAVDYFIPDDEGRKSGVGVMEFMDGIQQGYDAVFNQFIYAVMQSNNPFGFIEPTANMKDEPIKIKAGYMLPVANAKGINFVQIPPPNQFIQNMLELFNQWAQLLFGISDYTSGV